jgi:uncharacterized protein
MAGQSYPDKPANYVTDEADILSSEQQNSLNSKCKAFEDSTSNQLFVYITRSLKGQEMQPLCQEIFHKWHIGQKGKNNGVLIGIFIDDHKFRIHTGYGLEGVLPDLLTKKIQDEDMKPLFKDGDYYAGINKGLDQLIYYSAHEFIPEEKSESGMSWTGVLVGLYIFNAVLLTILYFSSKKSEKSDTTKKVVIVLACIFAFIPFLGAFLMFILFAVLGKVRPAASEGSYAYSSSGDSSWSSSDSSSSSSDFDGGGGGDSGGGGSDSDW